MSWAILGASSAMARAFARARAAEGCALVLVGRDAEDLERTAADLRTRGAEVQTLALDLTAEDAPARIAATQPGNVALFAGQMLDQGPLDGAGLSAMAEANWLGPTRILMALDLQDGSEIVAVSSVAGDRGRPKNWGYGAAKAALDATLSGLGAQLAPKVHVLTVKPGFVDTGMTWGLPGLFLVASPEDVVRDIDRARRRRRAVLYTPWFWRGIMLIIRTIPTPLFRRLDL